MGRGPDADWRAGGRGTAGPGAPVAQDTLRTPFFLFLMLPSGLTQGEEKPPKMGSEIAGPVSRGRLRKAVTFKGRQQLGTEVFHDKQLQLCEFPTCDLNTQGGVSLCSSTRLSPGKQRPPGKAFFPEGLPTQGQGTSPALGCRGGTGETLFPQVLLDL